MGITTWQVVQCRNCGWFQIKDFTKASFKCKRCEVVNRSMTKVKKFYTGSELYVAEECLERLRRRK